jgi:hypothetical protein
MEHLQPKLIEILSRYRIPVEDAEEMLEQLFLTLYMREGTLESPERWLLLSLKNRCLIYWRSRRERLSRDVDKSLLSVLDSPLVSDAEKDGMRRFLGEALAQLPEHCRGPLEQRYGLGGTKPASAPSGPSGPGGPPGPAGSPASLSASAPGSEHLLPCLQALTRMLVGDRAPDPAPDLAKERLEA